MLGLPDEENKFDMFTRFDTIQECEQRGRPTDGQAQRDGIASRYA